MPHILYLSNCFLLMFNLFLYPLYFLSAGSLDANNFLLTSVVVYSAYHHLIKKQIPGVP